MARHNQWHFALTGWRVLFIPLAFVVAVVAALFVRILGLKNSADLTSDDVADYLQNFIDGRGGDWDWDDFTSIPISDPALEAIRQEAEMVRLPIDEAGVSKLGNLLVRARALRDA